MLDLNYEQLKNLYVIVRCNRFSKIKSLLNILDDNVVKEAITFHKLTPKTIRILLLYLEEHDYKFPECKVCSKEHVKVTMSRIAEGCCKEHQKVITLENYKKTCIEKYGTTNVSQCKFVKDKKEQTSLKNWGTKNPYQAEEVKRRIKITMIDRYSIEHPMQSELFKERQRQTALQNFGYEYPGFQDPVKRKESIERYKKQTGYDHWNYNVEVQSKAKERYKKQTGYDHWSKNPEVQEKSRQTCVKKYGTEYPYQNQDIFEKRELSARKKRYTYWLNNTEYSTSGYESQCLDYLLKIEKIPELDIALKRLDGMPSIPYKVNDKNRVYHPDIYIKSQNRIIEVKSTYTYQRDLEVNLKKQKACLELGYKFNFYIMNQDGSLHEIL